MLQAGHLVIWLDVAAVLVGAFFPFFIRGRFRAGIISFPHLAERFELITIITFGEGIVGMTEFFDVKSFSMRPVLVFAVIILLFGCYVTQIHCLCDHQISLRYHKGGLKYDREQEHDPLPGYPMGGAALRILPALYAAEVYRRLRTITSFTEVTFRTCQQK